jgi:hypothetical protein
MDVKESSPAGSGNASPFVHPDRQMSIVSTSADAPGFSSADRTGMSEAVGNSRGEGPSGGEPVTKSVYRTTAVRTPIADISLSLHHLATFLGDRESWATKKRSVGNDYSGICWVL